MNQIETMNYEINKLKEVIGSKNAELEQNWLKNNKIKTNYEDTVALMQRENDDLRDKMA